MRWFSQWPEQQARVVRWVLLTGWCLLILSLLIPALTLPTSLAPGCEPNAVDCLMHRQPGNRLFWGVVVPTGLLILVVGSHEFWRRICPLAFVSQAARSLGIQRKVANKKGRLEPVKVKSDSWLARHHVQLQWTLLIAGLCLRLLVVNSSPIGLAWLLIFTLAAAALVGWFYAGKAWCQYICPMGPVQTILTGQRSALGGAAHIGSTSKITQSMCRSIADSGKEQSACVACQASCIDIDSERHYWQFLRGKRGLAWAWYSYPGLILMFFELMMAVEAHMAPQDSELTYLRDGRWAFDATLPARALDPLHSWLPFPRLVVIPLLLVLAGWISVAVFQGIERAFLHQYEQSGLPGAADLAVSRTRLLATFFSINFFFWFVDPSQGAFGPHGAQWMRSLVLAISAIVLFRSWARDQSTYRRESTTDSLRRQLQQLPDLDAALDGRRLQDLSAQEVFTLAKALPAAVRGRASEIYQGGIRDLIRNGSLDRAAALVDLEELRQSLQLSEEDHHAAIRFLAADEPSLLQLDERTLQLQQLREEAFAEVVEDFLATSGLQTLDAASLPAQLRSRLERLKLDSGLEDVDAERVLSRFHSTGDLARLRLQTRLQQFIQERARFLVLQERASDQVLLHPLALAMEQRLNGIAELLPPDVLESELEQIPDQNASLDEALDTLWMDPDPDTAGWVLMVERLIRPEIVASRLQSGRPGLGSSMFLDSQLKGQKHRDHDEFPHLANSSLFRDLLPSGLLWVAEHGWLKSWSAGDVVNRKNLILLILRGGATETTDGGQLVQHDVGSVMGAMEVISGEPSMSKLQASPDGLNVFAFPVHAFDELLQRSSHFSHGLLRQLAKRLKRSGETPMGAPV